MPQQPPTILTSPEFGEFADQLGHIFGALVVKTEFVGQARIRIGADQRIGNARKLSEMRAHLACAERAIEPDRQRCRVLQRIPERRRRLARECTARQIGDRARNHHRQFAADLLEHIVDASISRFGIERVENRFNQQNIRTAFDKGFGRLSIGGSQLVETDSAKARIVDVG